MNAVLSLLAHPLAERLGWTMLHFLWQGVALALVLMVVLLILRQRSANVRYLTCAVVLLAMLAAPLATFMRVPAPSVNSSAASAVPNLAPVNMTPSPSAGAALVLAPSGDNTATPPIQVDARHAASVSFAERLRPLAPWCGAAWMLGVMLLSLRLFGGWLRLRLLVRRKLEPLSHEMQGMLAALAGRLAATRPVEAFLSAMIEVPSTIGWLRPMILLPMAALAGLSPEQVEAILAHELAHIRRHDYLVNLLQSVVEVLLFYHPAVWWASRRMRQEREHCCDDLALSVCPDARAYAHALAALEERRTRDYSLAPASQGGRLTVRIRRILSRGNTMQTRFSQNVAGLVLLVVFSMVAASVVFSLYSQAQPASASNLPPADMIGTWRFYNDIGDDEQMSIFPDGRVFFFYANGHMDREMYSPEGVRQPEFHSSHTMKLTSIHKDWIESEGKRWGRIDAEPRAQAVIFPASSGEEKPQSVTVLLTPDGLVYDGSPTTWQELAPILRTVPDPSHHVLALGCTSGDIPVEQFFIAQAKGMQLVNQLGFKYFSNIGVQSEEPQQQGAAPHVLSPSAPDPLAQFAVVAASPEESRDTNKDVVRLLKEPGNPEQVKQVEDVRDRIASFEHQAAAYRSRFPAYQRFQELLHNDVIPAAMEGEKWRLMYLEAVQKLGPDALTAEMKYDHNQANSFVDAIIYEWFSDLVRQFGEIVDSGELDLSAKEGLRFVQLKGKMKELEENHQAPPQINQVFSDNSLAHGNFLNDLQSASLTVAGILALIAVKLPPELEAKRLEIEKLRALLVAGGLLASDNKDVYVDAYARFLENEVDRVEMITRMHWDAKRELEGLMKRLGPH